MLDWSGSLLPYIRCIFISLFKFHPANLCLLKQLNQKIYNLDLLLIQTKGRKNIHMLGAIVGRAQSKDSFKDHFENVNIL